MAPARSYWILLPQCDWLVCIFLPLFDNDFAVIGINEVNEEVRY